jgi:hypothetical protein
MRHPLTILAVVLTMSSASLAHTAASGNLTSTLLRLDGIGPLHLGMTRQAALATGWLAQRAPGCELAGTPRPITYRLTGAKAPAGITGTVEFDHGRLRTLAFTGGVRTASGVVVGRTTAKQMVARYRASGLGASARYDSAFQATFVTVRRNGRQVIGGLAEKGSLTILGIPYVPVCE